MPIRRLTPRRVVITGVENAGKSTLARHLSDALGWPLVPEAARTDAAVTEDRTTPDDLQRLLDGIRSALDVSQDTLFDTGPIVLDLWARAVWNHTSREWRPPETTSTYSSSVTPFRTGNPTHCGRCPDGKTVRHSKPSMSRRWTGAVGPGPACRWPRSPSGSNGPAKP